MKQLIQIFSLLIVSSVFYGQKQENPILKELNEIILNTKLYGGFYNGMTREIATNEYETNKYSKYYNITFPGVNHKFSLQNDPRGWDGVGEGKLNQVLGPNDVLGDPNLSAKFQNVSIIEVELFGKLYYTPKEGLIAVKLFSSEAGNSSNYKESLKGILDFLSFAIDFCFLYPHLCEGLPPTSDIVVPTSISPILIVAVAAVFERGT